MKYTIIHVNDRAKTNIERNKKILPSFEYIDNIKFFNGNEENYSDVFNHLGVKQNAWLPYDGRSNPPLPGEMGVWISTINSWQYMIDNDLEYLLLLEDDILLQENFVENLSLCTQDLPDTFDFLSLYYFNGQNELTDKTNIGSEYIHLSHNQYSAGQATLYSLKGAKKILKLVNRKGIEYTSDCFYFHQASLGLLDGYSIVPNSLSFLKHDNKKIKSLIDPNNIRLTE